LLLNDCGAAVYNALTRSVIYPEERSWRGAGRFQVDALAARGERKDIYAVLFWSAFVYVGRLLVLIEAGVVGSFSRDVGVSAQFYTLAGDHIQAVLRPQRHALPNGAVCWRNEQTVLVVCAVNSVFLILFEADAVLIQSRVVGRIRYIDARLLR
jgi:hypothetical protein